MGEGSAMVLTPAASPRDGWAAAELGDAELGDARRAERLVRLASDLAANPTASVAAASGDWAGAKAAYRFLAASETDPDARIPEEILAAHRRATLGRLAGAPLVLAVQDTTDLDLGHFGAMGGTGPLENGWMRGLFVHTTLAVGADGVPLGLLAQQTWARDAAETGKRHRRKGRPIAEKESRKWLTALAEAGAGLPEGVTLVHVGDRESDIYELFALAEETENAELLVRAAWDRRAEGAEGYLWATLLAAPVADTRVVALPRAVDRPERAARLALRFAPVDLRPPRRPAGLKLPPLTLNAILVREVEPPAGAKPVEWLLLTSLPVGDLAAAWEKVRWYGYRWRVERYHFVLKSGCRIEHRQLGNAERLRALLAVFAVVAVRLLQLTYRARRDPEAPGLALVTAEEWAVLWASRHRDRPPPPAPSARQVVREIAALGGFLGRKGDGEPGVITLWRGLIRLEDLITGYHLASHLQKLNQNVGTA